MGVVNTVPFRDGQTDNALNKIKCYGIWSQISLSKRRLWVTLVTFVVKYSLQKVEVTVVVYLMCA